MSMLSSDAVKEICIIASRERDKYFTGSETWKSINEALEVVHAEFEKLEAYRIIGTQEEFKALKEKTDITEICSDAIEKTAKAIMEWICDKNGISSTDIAEIKRITTKVKKDIDIFPKSYEGGI